MHTDCIHVSMIQTHDISRFSMVFPKIGDAIGFSSPNLTVKGSVCVFLYTSPCGDCSCTNLSTMCLSCSINHKMVTEEIFTNKIWKGNWVRRWKIQTFLPLFQKVMLVSFSDLRKMASKMRELFFPYFKRLTHQNFHCNNILKTIIVG